MPRPRATTLHATKLAANILVRKVAETTRRRGGGGGGGAAFFNDYSLMTIHKLLMTIHNKVGPRNTCPARGTPITRKTEPGPVCVRLTNVNA